MAFLDGLLAASAYKLAFIIPGFLFVLTLVIFIHELGHFLVARWAGVKVLAFSIGFGPELFGFDDRHGTRWRVAAIPLGGYVRFAGDENAASAPDVGALERMSPQERRSSFFHAPLPNRAAIVAAGPIANFILAIAIFAGLFMTVGRPTFGPIVGVVEQGKAADAAGLKVGDVVAAIDGNPIATFEDIRQATAASGGRPMRIAVDRGRTRLEIDVTPRTGEVPDRFGEKQTTFMLGIGNDRRPENLSFEKLGPIDALSAGAGETWAVVAHTASYLGGLVIGQRSPDQIGGPIRIAKVAGEAAELGIASVFNLAAFLSVSIGLLNLVPIPMLDGGHLLYYAIEGLRGRPMGARAQEIGMRIGLAFVLFLMIFATWNDIVHISSLG